MDTHTSSLKGVYTLFKPQDVSYPILFDSPHSGSLYPDDFKFSCPQYALDRLSDLYVEELFCDVPQYGYTFLRAEFPRSYIDLNRSLEDIDSEILSDTWSGAISTKGRAKHGVGLVFTRGHERVLIYGDKLSSKEILGRINAFYAPYHRALMKEFSDLRRDHGHVLHINCHSFPSHQPFHQNGGRFPDFVLGDRFGATCSPHILQYIKDMIEKLGYCVAINNPYQGSVLIQKTGNPANHQHSLQIEINRSLYMNEETLRKIQHFAQLKKDIHLITENLHSLFLEKSLVAD